jgi:hypothetical protein
MEEVAMRVGYKVLAKVDNNTLIIIYPKGILVEQLKPCPIRSLNINTIV